MDDGLVSDEPSNLWLLPHLMNRIEKNSWAKQGGQHTTGYTLVMSEMPACP